MIGYAYLWLGIVFMLGRGILFLYDRRSTARNRQGNCAYCGVQLFFDETFLLKKHYVCPPCAETTTRTHLLIFWFFLAFLGMIGILVAIEHAAGAVAPHLVRFFGVFVLPMVLILWFIQREMQQYLPQRVSALELGGHPQILPRRNHTTFLVEARDGSGEFRTFPFMAESEDTLRQRITTMGWTIQQIITSHEPEDGRAGGAKTSSRETRNPP